VVASSPLVPGNDPTLMFTNSGMVQFKDVFLGTDKRPYVRAASVQACLRAGGKHNDLENVGYTARHHTFFEMLGNWSFGDYFKRESAEMGLGAADRGLQAAQGAPAGHGVRRGRRGLRHLDEGDRPAARARDPHRRQQGWPLQVRQLLDDGRHRPLRSVQRDLLRPRPHIPGGPPGSPDEDGDRFIEIWNNVFMQFNMDETGSVTPLPAPCVDTGMGLERLAAILQHVHSNYEIDIFDALIKAAARETNTSDLDNPSLKVIADHIRATAFLVSDGVIPSNEGRGYVQRRIVRRAIRHGYKLGQKTPFFHKLVPDLVKLMGAAYPNLARQEQRITEVLKAEEERFYETLANGMEILDAALAGGARRCCRATWPSSCTTPTASRSTCRPTSAASAACRWTRQASTPRWKSRRPRAARPASSRWTGAGVHGAGNQFVGYEQLEAPGKMRRALPRRHAGAALNEGQTGVVVLDNTPFYAESGGQVGDRASHQPARRSFAVGTRRRSRPTCSATTAAWSRARSRSATVNAQVEHGAPRRHRAQPQRSPT
jgi:alanyl-tRNA synthetase